MSIAMNQQPQQQQQPARPRAKSGFSFRSDKSGGSGNRGHIKKESLAESHDEKRKAHLSVTGKANPNAAITEVQPVAVALQQSTLASLRSSTYADQFGNPILEPDRSNPTRPRWERPLDTIRSFEAAIDSEYRQRKSMMRSEMGTEAGFGNGNGQSTRRNSTYWQGGYDQARPKYASGAGSVYGATSNYGGNRDSYAESNLGYQNTPRNRYSRQQSEPIMNRYPNHAGGAYGGNSLQQSRDNLDYGAVSGSGSEQWTNNTDPSSEESSIDRARMGGEVQQHGHVDHAGGQYTPQFRTPMGQPNSYAANGYSNGPSGGNGYFPQNNGASLPPVPPQRVEGVQRKAIGLNAPLQASSGNAVRPPLQSQPSDKRKSWIRRKFGSKD